PVRHRGLYRGRLAISALRGNTILRRVHAARTQGGPSARYHAMMMRDWRAAFYPLFGVAAILVLWQAYVVMFGVSRIVLPGPIDIARSSIENWQILLRESWPTFVESVLGFG